MSKIQLTPSELQTQANEMQALETEYSILFTGVSSDLKNVNGNWSANLSNNFEGKINSAQNSFIQITQELMKGSKVANTCAVTFESVDSLLAKDFDNDISSENTGDVLEETKVPVSIDNYTEKCKDAEYALLCHMIHKVRNKKDIKGEFLAELTRDGKNSLPEGSPLRNLNDEQITVTKGTDGFLAITIEDGNGNALVIYDSTDWLELGDLAADGNILIGNKSSQSTQAIELMEKVSKNNSNITTIGHSLGGYLATSATLKNSAVTKCVAFDPPGRYDAGFQALFNREQFNKVTTYEAVGSVVSAVGAEVGSYEPIFIDGKDNFCHGIVQISNALNKQDSMENAWK